MAVITVPAPARRESSGNILNFLMQLSSAEDRKKSLALQQQQIDVSKGALGVSIGQLDIAKEKLPYEIKDIDSLLDYRDKLGQYNVALAKQIKVLTIEAERASDYKRDTETIQKDIDTAKAMGDKNAANLLREQAVMLKSKNEAYDSLYYSSKPGDYELYQQLILSEEFGKLATTELRGNQSTIQSLQTAIQAGELQRKAEKDVQDQENLVKKKFVDATMKWEDPALQAAGMYAIQNNDIEAFMAIAKKATESAGKVKQQEFAQEKELKQTSTPGPVSPYGLKKKAVNYESGTLVRYEKAQAVGESFPFAVTIKRTPEIMRGPLAAWVTGEEDEVIIDVQAAVDLGTEREFAAAWLLQKDAPLPKPIEDAISAKGAAKKAIGKMTPTGKTKPKAEGKQLTVEMATEYLRKAGYDKEKAMEMARKDGYTW